MNFVFLVDNYPSWNREKDTSFSLMLAAQKKDHTVFLLYQNGMFLKDGKCYFNVTQVKPTRDGKNPFIDQNNLTLSQEQVHAVFIRTDPPFDAKYLQNTWFLDLLPKNIAIINRPSAIRSTNEKLWAMQFTKLIPSSFVGSHKHNLLEFISEYKHVIVKPLNGFGGQGIFSIKEDDINKNVILESLTNNYTQEIILQKFIPEAKNGDKRILLLNGEPLGAILRVHSKDDHRNNFFAGGKPVETKITKRDLEIINTLKPELIKMGLYFVGIDIIGEYLIEVNVTSPTCLQEISAAAKKPLQDNVIAFAENLVDQS